ncbi:hypothetical protein GCM10009560_34910 [Nonomuraea longicatena]|uniref:Integrase catalytic domain-containing protein n=1 Tax=Nonomuraea longicatena TaxID=83682 RepID=A0ABP4A5H9_9ACTN
MVNPKRVERVMREHGIAGLHLRKKVRTTIPEPDAAPVPDLLQRDFTAERPNTRYVGDITYLPVSGGRFLSLATVVDLYSRRLVGWSIADHMRTELVVDALQAAAHTRGGRLDGAIFHSDNGAQYCSREFARACRRLGVTRSRAAVGTSAEVSRRRESHPPPLSEPCVTVSRYTAPIVEPVGKAPCRQWANMPG